jgi:murein DD-endopeptidase MepM/ murein hydrolase activator NlpD
MLYNRGGILMIKKKISTLLLTLIFLATSTSIISTSLKAFGNLQPGELSPQLDSDSLVFEAQQINEAYLIQSSTPTLIEYIIKANDTVEAIASTYGLKETTITVSNGITKDSVLKESEKLKFPSIDGIAYRIKSGETLWDISFLYKIDFDELVEVNKLTSPEKLKLDQIIIIPGAEGIKSPATYTVKKSTASSAPSSSLSRGGVWPALGTVTSKFGQRWGRDHDGIDIAAAIGTNVRAFMGGKVSFSGWQDGYGNLVIIDHGNGLKTYYGHNSKLLVKVGQTVDTSAIIAKSGNTGRSTGPHIHFEVRKNGNPVNPLPYLK